VSVFVEYEDDPGFRVGDSFHMNGISFRITGIRDNGRGLWLSLSYT
jgi:hypothetical protein